MMKRLLSIIFALFAILVARADTALLPASIDFNNPGLWGREIMFGLTDEGGYSTSATRWYVGGGAEASGAFVRRHSESTTGYLQTAFGSNVHRTFAVLPRDGKNGPSSVYGQEVSKHGVYIDTLVSMSAYAQQDEPRIFDREKDKINCWLCIPENRNWSETNFIVTAGSAAGATNYVTDAKVVPGEEFRLMIKAIAEGSNVVFEVYVNNTQVRSGDVTRFPSMLGDESEFATKLYSFGVDGAATVEKINFTGVDPRDDPEYDVDDVSMLRERVEISVPGYDSTAGLEGFPLLVRVSESAIRGFYYSRAAADGSDIRFTDGNGKIIPHEIDTWNPGGESLIWVKVPYLVRGTKITMHWALKPGYAISPNDSTEVWSDYIAVWHFNDLDTEPLLQTKDSTGHGFTARVNGSGRLSVAGSSVFGLAATAVDGRLVAPDYEERFPLKGKFTFTGWYMAPGATTTGWQMFGKKVGGEVSAAGSLGWCGAFHGYSNLRFYFDGNDFGGAAVEDMRNNWLHAGFVYSDDSRAEVYANGVCTADVAAKITPNATNFNLIARNGLFADELRISGKVRTAAWIKAEYEQASVENYLSYLPATVKDDDNYWIEQPFVRSASVSVEEADSVVVYPGRARFGSVIVSFVDVAGNESFVQPTSAGAYKAVFLVKDGVRKGLRKEIPFVIYEKRAYRKLAGHDRVMLFNSDASPDCPVDLQGYYDVDSMTNRVWFHDANEWTGVGDFVGIGANHIYYEAETGRKLWEFRHARIGNLFRSDTTLAGGMNFLPWGGYAKRYDDSELPANRQRDAGTLILQNRSTKSIPENADPNDPAAAYSPFYETGVGTIYFDAVNAFCGYRNRLRVQICGTDDETVTDGEWTDLKLDVFAIRDGVYDESMSTTGVDEVILEMNKGRGSTNWFYRIRANVDTNAAVRVRIIRTDDDWGYDDDDDGLISIDNIIVSYPAMGVAISQYGAPAEPDNLVLRGQRAPFDVAFPAASDLGNLHAQVKVDYLVNNTNEVDASFVGALTFRYRWRYLDQIVGEWTELLLQPSADDPTRFVSIDPLVGEGLGDIEYNCEAVVNAPFYEYHDYSGLSGWVWPDAFTERRGDVAISAEADGVYSPERRSPALGTDYFVRLREGKSDYQGFRLYVRSADEQPEKAKVYEMKLASDNTWRAFCPTFSAVDAGLLYRVEAYNRQTATGCDYQYNSTFYHGHDRTELPINDAIDEGDGWAKIPCDGVTGYLMFQIEDNTHSLVIIHADYQNFNMWTDAYSPVEDPYFTGTSADLPTSGVSRAAVSYNDTLAGYSETVPTNRLWEEHFNVSEAERAGFPIEEAFIGSRETPSGWSAANGMWLCERFRLQGDSIALQMQGGGYGLLSFPQRTPFPRGLEVFSYRARLAQTYDIHSFNFYAGAGTTNDVYNMSGYTFAVSTAMTLTNDSRYKGDFADFDGVGSISLVARYRESKGGYEFRVERVDEKDVQLCLYKWMDDDSEPQLLGRGPLLSRYAAFGLDGTDEKCGVCFISCTNTETSVRITAGILSAGRSVQNENFSGRSYYKVSYEDFTTTRHLSGTFGIGSKDCPAVFVRPRLSRDSVTWKEDATRYVEGFRYWNEAKDVTFADEFSLIENEDDYDAWNVYTSRIGINEYKSASGASYHGFAAKMPAQNLVLEASPHNENKWEAVAINTIKSFMFEDYPTRLYLAEDVDVRLRSSETTSGADIVVDDAGLRQWRGENYNDSGNPDRLLFYDVDYGAPTNFVYTTAWIADDTAAELSPMRTTANQPAGMRSPLMDGLNGRGLGLGSFSFAYRNADPRARLLVQVATNGVSRNGLKDLTSAIYGWDTVQTFTFDDMTEEELESGVCNCYLGLHGVVGVMRVIVDPTLVAEARDPEANPGLDPAYGRIYLTMVGAKDNPTLDTGSWWGWNLRTTGDPMKKLLDDGTKNDTRVDGLSYGLNNSIVSNVKPGDEYKQHMPFLQTPIFGRGVIGEVSFKARKYEAGDYPPTVSIYGTTSHDPEATDADFEYLGEVLVDCDRYETFTFQAPISRDFTAFRLAVTGVDGVTGDPGRYPASGRVRRVLIDEVAVFEAIRARLGFCNVGAFRSRLGDDFVISNFPRKDEQPLCNESWGVQTELYAAQLSEKIDLSTKGREPRVFFHWYEGTSPWGYEKWKDNPAANCGELARAVSANGETNLVFRSGYILAPEAVVEPSKTPGTIVQFSLEVVYYMEGQADPLTNTLTSADWIKPPWYEPIDCNEQYGGKDGKFSAYNILDTVAPGWAWFNEVNIFGDYNDNFANTDANYQYLEIAAPAEADLTDWSVRMLLSDTGSLSVRTNTVATFGYGDLEPTKPDLIGQASGMVFRVISSYPSFSSGKLRRKDGTCDGTWTFDNPDGSVFQSSGVIAEDEPFGIQLVRPSGIVEHEIVVMGTNYWGSSSRYADQYDPSNTVNYLNKYMKGAHFFHIGDDDGGPTKAISVWDSRGEATNFWDKTMIHTPGRINTYADGTPQILSPEHPTPFGTSIFIYANLGSGHIRQTVGDAVDSESSQILVIQRGSLVGTDITYRVDKWYELGTVTFNGSNVTDRIQVEDQVWRVNVGRGASNNVTVVASVSVCEELRGYGVDENNRYTPAVIDWLENGVDMFGNEWPQSEDGHIHIAKFVPYRRGIDSAMDMTLTQMYWLDMCPMISNQYFIAGFSQPSMPHERPAKDLGYMGDASLTNVRMSVYMAISNGLHATESQPLEAPYVIRGVDPGSSSWAYATNTVAGNWTNANFKITGILANGLTSETNQYNWVPLRWFVFDRDSFYRPDDPNPLKRAKAFTTEIEVADPYSELSPAFDDWNDWIIRHGWRPLVFFGWAIDERMRPIEVEILKENNYYQTE